MEAEADNDNDKRGDDERKIEALPMEVLWKIFGGSDILSPGDVLKCRAVCKTWRDGATSFLLKQNCVQVVLRLTVHKGEREGGIGTYLLPEWVTLTRNNALQPNQPPTSPTPLDLTECISKSPAFPTTTICFDASADDDEDFGNRDGSIWNSDDVAEHQRDLLQFFLIHGQKMKSLRLIGLFPAKTLQSILYEHMPHLECLDLEEFCELFVSVGNGDEDRIGDDTILLRQGSQENIGIKEIILHRDKSSSHLKLLKELLQISPKLITIQNVNIPVLKVLLSTKKSYLCQRLSCRPQRDDFSVLQEFSDLLKHPTALLPCHIALRPTLIELDCNFLDFFFGHSPHPHYSLLMSALNSILKESKDTLKYLSFSTVPKKPSNSCKIKIPSMPKLVSLRLVELNSYYDYGRQPHWKDWDADDRFSVFSALNNYVADITGTYARNFVQFDGQGKRNSSKIPGNSFPRLRKVDLCVQRHIGTSKKLVGFFELDCLGEAGDSDGDVGPPSEIPENRILSVTELEMPCFLLGSDQLSKTFPNISSLTITSPFKFRNTVWTTFPLLKKFEIYERPSCDRMSVAAVDSFFTGIPKELCIKFLSESTEGLGLSSAQVKFFRTKPYIGSCQNLIEFKIDFKTRLENTFASKLSAMYGFRELGPQTKCIFSFKSLGLSREGVGDMRKWLASLHPYVHIET